MSEVVLLQLNTDLLQQVEDYVRECTTSTKYWPLSTSWRLCQRLYYFYQILTSFNKLKIMSEVVLLLLNTDLLQQVEDYVRRCTTSTKYWPPSTSWRLCQRLYYFYQILTSFNKLKIMSEVVLLLLNTDLLQQVEDYARGCTTSTNTDLLQQVEDYVRGCTTSTNTDPLQQVEDYVRGCTTSTKYWLPSTSWRLCQRLYYYQILTSFRKLKIMSEVVLLIPNTDLLQQVEDYVRECTTSTKYWPLSTSWRLCQRLYYFYHILTSFNKLKIMSEVVLLLLNTDLLQQVEDYVRGCTTSTKYWPPSTSWRLYRKLYY